MHACTQEPSAVTAILSIASNRTSVGMWSAGTPGLYSSRAGCGSKHHTWGWVDWPAPRPFVRAVRIHLAQHAGHSGPASAREAMCCCCASVPVKRDIVIPIQAMSPGSRGQPCLLPPPPPPPSTPPMQREVCPGRIGRPAPGSHRFVTLQCIEATSGLSRPRAGRGQGWGLPLGALLSLSKPADGQRGSLTPDSGGPPI